MMNSQRVRVTWCSRNKEHFQNKGYNYTKSGDSFWADISELPEKSHIKIDATCSSCGRDYQVRYIVWKSQNQRGVKPKCESCILREKQETYFKRISEFCKDNDYTLVSTKEEILNAQTQIKYICPLHGENVTRITSIFQGKRCYKCSRKTALEHKNATTLSKRQESLYSRVLLLAKEKGYVIDTPKEHIQKNTSEIEYICPSHGRHKMRINNFLSGKGCPECSQDKVRNQFKDSEDSVNKRITAVGGIWLNKGEYKNRKEKNLQILCPNCKEKVITSSLVTFTQHGGQVCDECTKQGSQGERRIKQYLEGHNIPYIQEKWFPDCRDVKPLPFDFFLPENNIAIEFDGKQHFSDRNYKNSTFKDTLEYTQAHDRIKTDYCIQSGIELIRIPYWQYSHIENILNDKLYLH